MLGDCGSASLNSDTSELTDARLLGRLLPRLPASQSTQYTLHYYNINSLLVVCAATHTAIQAGIK